jgi:glycosyltransferase involved in cell wall biosynthesis
MRIVHIVPGSGGTFYCQNCLRDTTLIPALRRMGVDVVLAPMYLPLFSDESQENLTQAPVFFGAISTYLREKISILRNAPNWFDKILNTSGMLKLAARKSGVTKADGLEDMTISVLRGENGNQGKALDRLVEWLAAPDVRPDLIHLSNPLLLGLAPKLKARFNVPLFCSMQDEEGWIDSMNQEDSQTVWKLMAELSEHVDLFVSVSQYYAGVMSRRMKLKESKIRIVPVGIDFEKYSQRTAPADPPTIGYISKISPQYGFDILVDAFMELKKLDEFSTLRLRATGGMTEDVEEFIKTCRKKLGSQSLLSDVDFVPSFTLRDRISFLHTLSVLCVPVPGGEAFGNYITEAMACGIPVLQPTAGAYPEIIEDTGGGVLYVPNEAGQPAKALAEMLRDSEHMATLGRAGRRAVAARYSVDITGQQLIALYREFCGEPNV